jgi:protein-serine/threonine kinase
MPWRAAQTSDTLYVAYLSACAAQHKDKDKDKDKDVVYPPTINNLSPRACRSLIRKMLEPDPKLRFSIEDVMAHSWVQGIEVCHAVAKPTHVHVHAMQQAQAQIL